MSCSPEQARLNGAKSKGPVTRRGKEVASLNANKHGIMATRPPILATEDLETFQGMVQGLIDEYQPQTPTEHLLVQQVAMAWLRLHRLWGVEAAIANKEVLEAQRKVKYPSFKAKDSELGVLGLAHSRSNSWDKAMRKEREAFVELANYLHSSIIDECPKASSNYRLWLKGIADCISRSRKASLEARANNYEHMLTEKPWILINRLSNLITDGDGYIRKPLPDFNEIRLVVESALTAIEQEIERLDRALEEFERNQQAIAQANAESKGLQNPELFSRYERHITQQLNEALDRLARIKQERGNSSFIGSFGQNKVEEQSQSSLVV